MCVSVYVCVWVCVCGCDVRGGDGFSGLLSAMSKHVPSHISYTLSPHLTHTLLVSHTHTHTHTVLISSHLSLTHTHSPHLTHTHTYSPHLTHSLHLTHYRFSLVYDMSSCWIMLAGVMHNVSLFLESKQAAAAIYRLHATAYKQAKSNQNKP